MPNDALRWALGLAFQTLIGTVKRRAYPLGKWDLYRFQTLIGTVKRRVSQARLGLYRAFQTLIGTVKSSVKFADIF